jgi:hypothetical protein
MTLYTQRASSLRKQGPRANNSFRRNVKGLLHFIDNAMTCLGPCFRRDDAKGLRDEANWEVL